MIVIQPHVDIIVAYLSFKEAIVKLAIILTVVAWVLSIVTAYTDLAGYSEHLALFGRSGAVLTLLGASLEFKLSTKGQSDTEYVEGGPISMLAVGKATLLTESEKKIQYFAHSSVILGTFIWGFGDLINYL